MKHTVYVFFVGIGTMLLFQTIYAQGEPMEEASAAVFLEEYTDQFQDRFFEALKQKGIENYDKAIHLLLECKQMDENNKVVDHELAKAYFADKQYILAEEYGIAALVSQPDNPWYLNTLLEIVQSQGNTMERVKNHIPYKNNKLQENLVLIYYKQKDYANALKLLREMGESPFKGELTSKINDSMVSHVPDPQKEGTAFMAIEIEDNPLERYQSQIAALILKNEFGLLEKISLEALENFPVHPFFYYARGLALNRGLKYKEAILALETALEYWLEDDGLYNKIHIELAQAHKALGNTSKANMYLSKMKS